jgi:UTP--glucose-1-phosphate uridylyltransferase
VQITRAVITAAGRGTRQYPASDTVQKAMLPVVSRDGLIKPVLQIIAEEALKSGIEKICVVSAPGDEAVYRAHFRNYAVSAVQATREHLIHQYGTLTGRRPAADPGRAGSTTRGNRV